MCMRGQDGTDNAYVRDGLHGLCWDRCLLGWWSEAMTYPVITCHSPLEAVELVTRSCWHQGDCLFLFHFLAQPFGLGVSWL